MLDIENWQVSEPQAPYSVAPPPASINGTSGPETLVGTAGSDQIHGLGGDDSLNGGAGDDTLFGGAGADTLDGGGGYDTVSYIESENGLFVDLCATGRQSQSGYSFDTLIGIQHVIGTNGGDNLLAYSGGTDADHYQLDGGGGGDHLYVGLHVTRIDGGTHQGFDNDMVFFEPGVTGAIVANVATGVVTFNGAAWLHMTNVQDLFGSTGDDALTGSSAMNRLEGGGGADTLAGGSAGQDWLMGGDGVDTATFAAFGVGVTLDLAIDETSQSTGGANSVWMDGIEILVGTGFADVLKAGPEGLGLVGGDGDDTLFAGALTTSLDGGSGIDTANFSALGAHQISLADGQALATGGGPTTILSGLENVVGGAGADLIVGSSGANSLTGGGGADTLAGGGGADTLNGGDGLDVVSFAGGPAVSIDLTATGAQAAGGGTVVLAGIEGMIGSDGDDEVSIDSWSHDALFDGGAGRDLVRIASGSNAFVNLATDFTGFEDVAGGSGDDLITGNAVGNSLSGGLGDDTLEGGGGANTLDGGDGVDVASFASAPKGVKIDLRLATAQPFNGGSDVLIGIECLTGSSHNDALIAADGDTTLLGGAGKDRLELGLGEAYVQGEAGIDTVSFARWTDVSFDQLLGLASSTSGAHALIQSVENVEGGGGADRLVGNAAANLLWGMDGNDSLFGGGGRDVLDGGDGFDMVGFNATAALKIRLGIAGFQNTKGAGVEKLVSIEGVIGSGFADFIKGSALSESLDGGRGEDTLIGGDGADTLVGGQEADVLTGGKGTDVFAYLHEYDSVDAAQDLITDLTSQDWIDLSAIDANVQLSGNQAFVRVASFDGNAGEMVVTYSSATNTTKIMLYTDDFSSEVDSVIVVHGDQRDFSNFVL